MHGAGRAVVAGRFMINRNGSTSRKTMAMARKVSTKASMAACRCTVPQRHIGLRGGGRGSPPCIIMAPCESLQNAWVCEFRV